MRSDLVTMSGALSLEGHRRDRKWSGHYVEGPQPEGHTRDRKWPAHHVGGPQPEGHRRDGK